MSDRTKELYEGLAKAKAMRAHAEECGKAISRTADAWLPAAMKAYKRMQGSEVDAVDPTYNAAGALSLARGIQRLRELRDGY